MPIDYDVIAVIGGSGTNDHLWGNRQLTDYLKQAYNDKVLVSGICAGTVAIAETGLLAGRAAACYPIDLQKEKLKAYEVEYSDQHVVAHRDSYCRRWSGWSCRIRRGSRSALLQ